MKTRIFIFLLIAFSTVLLPQKKVYLVLGSDTAIWDGMNTGRYNCTYNITLYSDVTKTPYQVMQPGFRNRYVDSYGTPVKMTWWMMAGNIFRHATNNNVPLANTMTLWLMKKYYSQQIARWGDELTLHYHTFWWTDYNHDGIWYWNQALNFTETREDFDVTLAQFLLEESVFPVSFRSGWHYMDNEWQNYLDKILPYSLHNDYPAKRADLTEPLDNTYDWSLASPEFVPFKPHPDNYQLPGGTRGWNVRSEYMKSVSQSMMNTIFSKANAGTDQLACFWSHLPETDYLEQVGRVDTLAHKAALLYPNVQFQYCTAIEAYQLWLKGNDTIKPEITLTEEVSGSDRKFVVTSNEAIYQDQPFLAVRDLYDRYMVADMVQTSPNTWKTVESWDVNRLGKVGVALTDTMGNQSMAFIKYLPDEKYIDNHDAGYSEVSGSFTTSNTSSWGTDSRVASLNPGDSARVRWNFVAEKSGWHSAFIQFPNISGQVDTLSIKVYKNGFPDESFIYANNAPRNKWSYLKTKQLEAGSIYSFEVTGKNTSASQKFMAADVMKFSAYVRDRSLIYGQTLLDMGEVSEEDTLKIDLPVRNDGISELTINSVTSQAGLVQFTGQSPLLLGSMSAAVLPLQFIPQTRGSFIDTVVITSNDPINPVIKIPFHAKVVPYFEIVDDADLSGYSETGTWFKSVAQAYGNSSRYANINSTPAYPSATFNFTLSKAGNFSVAYIVPATTNSANNALYLVKSGGVVIDSIYKNQNTESGQWVVLGNYDFTEGQNVQVTVIDSRQSTTGPVIRADAVKIYIPDPTGVDEVAGNSAPGSFALAQNYPNPFNPNTVIRFSLPARPFGDAADVRLTVYNSIGQKVATLVNRYKEAGSHEVSFNAAGFPSGIYFYSLEFGDNRLTRKMILLK